MFLGEFATVKRQKQVQDRIVVSARRKCALRPFSVNLCAMMVDPLQCRSWQIESVKLLVPAVTTTVSATYFAPLPKIKITFGAIFDSSCQFVRLSSRVVTVYTFRRDRTQNLRAESNGRGCWFKLHARELHMQEHARTCERTQPETLFGWTVDTREVASNDC